MIITSEIQIQNIIDARINSYTALWDTGATGIHISDKVISDLSLDQYGEVDVNFLTGPSIKCKTYICLLYLADHNKCAQISAIGYTKHKDFDVLIGMELIEKGIFVLDHGKFSFTINSLK